MFIDWKGVNSLPLPPSICRVQVIPFQIQKVFWGVGINKLILYENLYEMEQPRKSYRREIEFV